MWVDDIVHFDGGCTSLPIITLVCTSLALKLRPVTSYTGSNWKWTVNVSELFHLVKWHLVIPYWEKNMLLVFLAANVQTDNFCSSRIRRSINKSKSLNSLKFKIPPDFTQFALLDWLLTWHGHCIKACVFPYTL